MNSIILYVVNISVLSLLQTKISAEFSNAPYEVIAQIQTCASSAKPIVLQRASDDARWVARIIVDVGFDGLILSGK